MEVNESSLLWNSSNISNCIEYTDSSIIDHLAPSTNLINKYFTIVWFVLGLPGNILSLVVWSRRKMRPSSGSYLAALAINDFLFLVLLIIFDLQVAWELSVYDMPVFCESFAMLFNALQHLSVYFVLAFTFDRYISICHPYKHEKFASTRLTVGIIAFLIVFSILSNVVHLYFYTFNPSIGCNVRPEFAPNGSRYLVYLVHAGIIELFTFLILPLLIICLNIRVIYEIRSLVLRDPTKNRKTTTLLNGGKSKEVTTAPTGGYQSATTAMLLVVSFYHIIVTLPVTIMYILLYFLPGGPDCLDPDLLHSDERLVVRANYWFVRQIIQELGVSHYALNFFIYLATGAKFRAQLRLVLLQPCGEREAGFDENSMRTRVQSRSR